MHYRAIAPERMERMISITSEQISMLAPNAAAAANGKKISQKNGFVKLYRSADGTYIGGECTGSGKSNYITSADFINENAPVFRCSCPSRQFPCKHSIGLLYEYLAGKNFQECEIPQDILDKRKKKEVQKEKKEQQSKEPKKVNKAAVTKKIKKQLEGLDVLDRFIEEVATKGLASLSGNALKTYEELAKQMGDYYLPGPQVLMRELFLLVKEESEQDSKKGLQKSAITSGNIAADEILDAQTERLEDMLLVMTKLRAVSKKGREFLSAKLKEDSVEPEDSMIYEHLGTIWQLTQLGELGLKKENARLIQLSFYVYYNEAKEEYADTGYWADLDTGVISKTENLRPKKAVKYVKQDDTVFDILQIPTLYYYPGELNKRIRFEEFQTASVTKEDIAKLRSLAAQKLPEQLKVVKNQIKNVLSESSVVAFIPFDFLGTCDTKTVLVQGDQKIELKAKKGMEDTVRRLHSMLPQSALSEQVLVGEYFYDHKAGQFCIMPHAVITQNAILRLLY